MSMYYLHRAGETTGPFPIGRLRQMWADGAISASDLVCERGTEEWIDAEVIAGSEMIDDHAGWQAPPKQRVAGKVPRWPFRAIGWIVAILGIGALITPYFLFGVLLILIASALGRPRFHCGACGNRVEKSSALCPTCRATLLPWTFADELRASRVGLIVIGILLVGALAFAALVVWG